MGALKKATAKSSTFWINSIAASAGAALMFFQHGATEIPTAMPALAPTAAAVADNASITITPDMVMMAAHLLGLSTGADVVGVVTISLALINQALRYKTQRAHEKQLNG